MKKALAVQARIMESSFWSLLGIQTRPDAPLFVFFFTKKCVGRRAARAAQRATGYRRGATGAARRASCQKASKLANASETSYVYGPSTEQKKNCVTHARSSAQLLLRVI